MPILIDVIDACDEGTTRFRDTRRQFLIIRKNAVADLSLFVRKTTLFVAHGYVDKETDVFI